MEKLKFQNGLEEHTITNSRSSITNQNNTGSFVLRLATKILTNLSSNIVYSLNSFVLVYQK